MRDIFSFILKNVLIHENYILQNLVDNYMVYYAAM